jgi:hypothetical protein
LCANHNRPANSWVFLIQLMLELQAMQITINDHRKIHAIQADFSEMFPYLKIEFLSKAKGASAEASSKLTRSSARTLGESRTIHKKGVLSITPGMSSADLEEGFRDVYGLTVRLYRKSGTEWLAITSTDKWTLQQQNEQGMALSKLL